MITCASPFEPVICVCVHILWEPYNKTSFTWPPSMTSTPPPLVLICHRTDLAGALPHSCPVTTGLSLPSRSWEWEIQAEKQYFDLMARPHVILSRQHWRARADLVLDKAAKSKLQKAITEVDQLSTPLIDTDGLDDGRFSMIVLDTSAKTVSIYGLCDLLIQSRLDLYGSYARLHPRVNPSEAPRRTFLEYVLWLRTTKLRTSRRWSGHRQ